MSNVGNWGQLKDSEFKKQFKETFPELLRANRYGSDIEFDTEERKTVIEYENSSRGMLSNLARIFDIYIKRQDSLTVIFLRTDLHVLKHRRDNRNTELFIKLIKDKHKIDIKIFKARDFDEWGKQIKKEVLPTSF